MPGRRPNQGSRPMRLMIPRLEGLDSRTLLSSLGIRHSLGPYVARFPLGPRIAQPAATVDSHDATYQVLAATLGPGLDEVQSHAQAQGNWKQNTLVDQVRSQPVIHKFLSNADTYLLLQSPAVSALTGTQPTFGQASQTEQTTTQPTETTTSTTQTGTVTTSADQTGTVATGLDQTTVSPTIGTIPIGTASTAIGTTPTDVGTAIGTTPTGVGTTVGTTTIPGTTVVTQPSAVSTTTTTTTSTTQTQSSQQSVLYQVPQQATILTLGEETSLVQVLAQDGSPGFFVQVPTTNIRTFPEGSAVQATVEVPLSSIPAGAPIPQNFNAAGGFAQPYLETAPLLLDELQSGAPLAAPNAPRTVPGLRLVSALATNRNISAGSLGFLRMLRLAVQRNVFTLNSDQSSQVTTALTQFADQVTTLNQNGAFSPSVPPAAPSLPVGPLVGTFEVSLGALRNLISVDPSVSGLQLPGGINFPGRLDIGYVFDRSGNFGLALTLRGPLLHPSSTPNPIDVAAGDLRIEVSNAPSLSALNGTRVVEGITLGSPQASDLTASNSNGVATFAVSTGYGVGFEYGTGVAYTQIIPLGNVFSIIPSAPRQ